MNLYLLLGFWQWVLLWEHDGKPGMSNSRPDMKQEEGTIMESVTGTPAATICG